MSVLTELQELEVKEICSRYGIPREEVTLGVNRFRQKSGNMHDVIRCWAKWEGISCGYQCEHTDGMFKKLEKDPGLVLPGILKNLINNILQDEQKARHTIALVERLKQHEVH